MIDIIVMDSIDMVREKYIKIYIDFRMIFKLLNTQKIEQRAVPNFFLYFFL